VPSISVSRRVIVARGYPLAKRLETLLARDRSMANNMCQKVVGEDFDLSRWQRSARRLRWGPAAELGLTHTVAALIGVGEFVEMRHRGARDATRDDHDELVAPQTTLPQVGGATGRLPLTRAIAGPTVAVIAIRLLEKEPAAISRILTVCRRPWRDRRNAQAREQGADSGIVKANCAGCSLPAQLRISRSS